MAKRFQHGSLQRLRRGGRLVWMGFWYDTSGQRKAKTLGTVADLTKTDAQEKLDALVRPVNEQRGTTSYTFGTFVTDVVFPWKRRHWKHSTRTSSENEITRILIPRFTDMPLSAFTRTILQDFLDDLASTPRVSTRERDNGTIPAWSIVAHSRWHLKMIFDIALNEGLLNRNPAALLHIPEGPRRERRILTIEQAKILFAAFPLRERLILKLCGILGLRPGEAIALQWGDLAPNGLHIQRRVYRGIIDTPKSTKGVRIAALSTGVQDDLNAWRALSPNTTPEAWMFPNENKNAPLWATNLWFDHVRPTLDTLGLSWVNYQVLRRSAASLMNQLGIDGKTVADQLGHTLDVSQNVYTQAGINQQRHAIETLDTALRT